MLQIYVPTNNLIVRTRPRANLVPVTEKEQRMIERVTGLGRQAAVGY